MSATSDSLGPSIGGFNPALQGAGGATRSSRRIGPPNGGTAMPLEFTGSGGEFFKIWIVNVCLTILTLGIYSAWAKVRTTRYFYANTRLKGSAFEYLADPITVLKGRLIGFAMLLAYIGVQNFIPAFEWVPMVLFFLAFPILVVKAMAFRNRNTAYRNVRFDFRGRYGEAARVYIGYFLLTMVTLGLAFPYFIYRQTLFVISNSAYGTQLFDVKALPQDFYAIYIKAIGMFLLGIVLLGALAGVGAALLGPNLLTMDLQDLENAPAMMTAVMVGSMLLIMPAYLWLGAYIQTQVTNLLWNHTLLDGHRLNSTLQTSKMFWLYISNALAIALTLGLLIPWAKVRMTRYRLDNLTFLAVGDLDGFVVSEGQKVDATGEGIGDVFDLEIGL